ncbi:hypothetical protein EC968_004418 [Mortierella alpina]|nr:hypothetical protein EC968_004418 [Mortierella alpina]
MPGFIHQVAPEPAVQTTATDAAQSADDHPLSPAQKHAIALTFNRKSYWAQPGIPAFIDWLTNQDNHKRLYTHRNLTGERVIDIHASIAEYVNSRASTAWTIDHVKQKVAYARLQYRRALDLIRRTGETEGALHARKLEICPYYDRLHVMYGSTLPGKLRSPSPSPPPRQLRKDRGKRMIVESSSDASDFEDYSPHDHEDGRQEQGEKGEGSASRSQASKDNGQRLANKRHGQEKKQSLESMGAMLDDLKKQTTAMTAANESLRASWEGQHEKVLKQYVKEHEELLHQRVEEREKMLQQRTQEREKMLQQRAQELDEVYERRRKVLEVEKEDFKAERERIMRRLEADRQELKDEQAELKRAQLDFSGERVRLVAENAKLAALLEVHMGLNRKHAA